LSRAAGCSRRTRASVASPPEKGLRQVDQARTYIPDPELHIYWWSIFPGEPVESATEALELVAKKVLPAFT